MLRPLPAIVLCFVVVSSLPAWAAEQDSPSETLQIDPLLIAQAAEVWTLIGADDNPLWPLWQGKNIPVLIYLPGRQDVLINHPSPPAGFVPYRGPIQFPVGQIHVRDGQTIFSLDGQNTSTDVAGTQTLVIADTLSNLRNSLSSIIAQASSAADNPTTLRFEQLSNNPYDTLGLIAHEAFHVFQHRAAPGKSGNELALTRYPTLAVTNTVGFALEGQFLAEALRTSDRQTVRDLAFRWLAVRQWRRRDLTPEDVAYEDGTEFNEGLAKYIEYRLLQSLEGRVPGPDMKWIRGFHGYDDLSAQREQLISRMVQHLSGKVNVNNDPYGASPLRMRLYYSGMAIAAVLDRLAEPTWHTTILQPDITLTALAHAAIDPQPEELEAAIAAIPQLPDYEAILEEKNELREAGSQWIASELASIENGATTVTIDYAQVPDAQVGMSFTPFGIVAVDSQRTIFRLIPISAKIGDAARFDQTSPAPVLQDRQARKFMFALPECVSREQLLQALDCSELREEPITAAELVLPGVKLRLNKAVVQWQQGRIEFALRP